MFPQATARSRYQPPPAAINKTRLLIVSDTSKRLIELRSLFNIGSLEITGAISSQDLPRICRDIHDLAVIDVGPEELPLVLETVRGSRGHEHISVLVEASRIVTEPSLAGLLPNYRAMPCSCHDLVKLVSYRVTQTDHHWKKPNLL